MESTEEVYLPAGCWTYRILLLIALETRDEPHGAPERATKALFLESRRAIQVECRKELGTRS